MPEINLIAHAQNDPSVGLASETWIVENVGTLDDYPDQRAEVRHAFASAFALITGSIVRVTFSDEHKD